MQIVRRTFTLSFFCFVAAACSGPVASGDAADSASEAAVDGAMDARVPTDGAMDAPVPTDGATDAPVPTDGMDAPTPTDVPCTDCVSSTVTWGWDGGFVSYQDRSTVMACRGFAFSRRAFGGPPDRMCSNELPACSAMTRPTVGDLQAALADPDVVRALAAAPMLYGRDTRPSDGQVFQIDVGGRRIEVGSDCGGASGCVAIPAGVARARELLLMITAAQLRVGTCATTFPDGG